METQVSKITLLLWRNCPGQCILNKARPQFALQADLRWFLCKVCRQCLLTVHFCLTATRRSFYRGRAKVGRQEKGNKGTSFVPFATQRRKEEGLPYCRLIFVQSIGDTHRRKGVWSLFCHALSFAQCRTTIPDAGWHRLSVPCCNNFCSCVLKLRRISGTGKAKARVDKYENKR